MNLPPRSLSPAPRSRPGFTLVELMVVIAIIGVVVTLAASATMQVITRQRGANTEVTIQKVNEALKAHWQAVIRQAQTEPIPNNILYGDGTMQGLLVMASPDPSNPGADPDATRRARMIWIKLRLKQQFPMNFMEALTPTPNTIRPANGRLPYVLLAPAPVFVQALVGTPALPWPVGQIPAANRANAVPQAYESSVCLLLALSQTHNGVPGFDQDRLASTERADANGLKMIVDAWGRPLTFYRWPMYGEIAASNPNSPNVTTASNINIIGDPLDPNALLTNANTWNPPGSYSARLGVWAFEKLFHPIHDFMTNKPTSYYTVPVVASAGPVSGSTASVYSMMGLPPPVELVPSASPPLPIALLHDPMKIAPGMPTNMLSPTADSFDNIYSFRMRFGARGD